MITFRWSFMYLWTTRHMVKNPKGYLTFFAIRGEKKEDGHSRNPTSGTSWHRQLVLSWAVIIKVTSSPGSNPFGYLYLSNGQYSMICVNREPTFPRGAVYLSVQIVYWLPKVTNTALHQPCIIVTQRFTLNYQIRFKQIGAFHISLAMERKAWHWIRVKPEIYLSFHESIENTTVVSFYLCTFCR